MKLLIFTQAADRNDPVLGFFHRWLQEFAKHCEQVTVICLKKGEYDLPSNVKVLSLGKEKGVSRVKYLERFYSYIWQEKRNYDAVFVHMNPEYVLLGGLLWRLWRKKISLWYVHRQVNFKLRLAEKFAHIVFTSSPESFRIVSQKVRYVGHGISLFPICAGRERCIGELVLLHVGRITPIKRCDVLLAAATILRNNFQNLKVVFVGDVATGGDLIYLEKLKSFIRENRLEKNVEFLGNLTRSQVQEEMCKADATVNLAPTGGMDKAVLESLAVEVPAFFANDAFLGIVREKSKEFYLNPASPEVVAEKITSYFSHEDKRDMHDLTTYVREYFSIEKLIGRIVPHL